jgi:hypothetical protein
MAIQRKRRIAKGTPLSPEPEPVLCAVFAMMGGGKTSLMERMAKQMQRRTIVVYNYGKPSDWKGYIPIELTLLNGELQFKYKGQEHPFELSFMHLFWRKRVKILGAINKKVEKAFYEALSNMNNNLKQLCLIIEDATSVLSNRLTTAQKGVFSRCKHKDIWVYMLSHHLHYFPVQMYTLLTHIILFKTLSPPPKQKRGIIEPNLFDQILKAWEWLSSPKRKYYHATITTHPLKLQKYNSNYKPIKK